MDNYYSFFKYLFLFLLAVNFISCSGDDTPLCENDLTALVKIFDETNCVPPEVKVNYSPKESIIGLSLDFEVPEGIVNVQSFSFFCNSYLENFEVMACDTLSLAVRSSGIFIK